MQAICIILWEISTHTLPGSTEQGPLKRKGLALQNFIAWARSLLTLLPVRYKIGFFFAFVGKESSLSAGSRFRLWAWPEHLISDSFSIPGLLCTICFRGVREQRLEDLYADFVLVKCALCKPQLCLFVNNFGFN